MNWFLHFIGVRPLTPGGAYNFWSGFGSDISELAIVCGLVSVYRRHKCQSCRRLALKGGRGTVEGTRFETCHKHTNAAVHSSLKEHHARAHPDLHAHLNPTKPEAAPVAETVAAKATGARKARGAVKKSTARGAKP